MAEQSPKHPRPDELPEDQRTGNEPNPSGKTPKTPQQMGWYGWRWAGR